MGVGWLIGDVLVGRLIDKADAHKIGRRAVKLGSTLEAVFAAPRKRVLGFRLVDQAQLGRELAEAAKQEAVLRGELFELPLLDTHCSCHRLLQSPQRNVTRRRKRYCSALPGTKQRPKRG